MNRIRRRRVASRAARLVVVRALVAACALALVRPVAAQAPVTIADLARIARVGSIDVARDGRRAVFTVRSIGVPDAAPGAVSDDPPADGLRNLEHVWALEIPVDGAAPTPRRLTWGDRNDRSPRLSPDGRHVVFLRRGATDATWARGADGGDAAEVPATATQVWIMPLDGGEARQLTWFARGAGDPQWSHDGRSLLVGVEVPMAALPGRPPWPETRPRAEVLRRAAEVDAPAGVADDPDALRRWLASRAEAGDPKVIDRLAFQGEQSLRGPMTVRHLVRVPLEPGPDARVRRLTSGFFDHQQGRELADGSGIVYLASKDARVHPDRADGRGLWRATLDGDAEEVLVPGDRWFVGSILPSPEGSVVAFSGRRAEDPYGAQSHLAVVPLAGELERELIWLTDAEILDHSVRAMAWMPERESVAFTAGVRGGVPLLAMGFGLLEPVTLVEAQDGLPIGVTGLASGGGTIVYAVTAPSNPCVLRVRDATGDRDVLDLNPWVADRALAMPVKGTVTRPDGLEVDYWVMEPPGRERRERVPVVVQIHGGPSAMWGPGEASMWHEFQLLCGQGWAVVYANPRGSGGYGEPFQRANYRDWGHGPAGDVLAAVDAAAALEWTDEDRLVVTGGSYGGYLTAWIVGHDDRFRAAVAQRGVYDLRTFYGEGNAYRLLERAMGGKPWEQRLESILRRESPFTYVARIRTPLLITHGDEDLRTGVSQSEMLFRALLDLGRDVEYARYPGAGHDLSRSGDPLQRMDRLGRIVEFFDRHLDDRR